MDASLNMKPDFHRIRHFAIISAFFAMACREGKTESAPTHLTPAGVVAYHCAHGEAHYLLAFDTAPTRQAYGAPGGSAKEGETTEETAIREFREETNCVYDANELSLHSPNRSERFTSYWARVEHRALDAIRRSRCASKEGSGETSDFRWVAHSLLVEDFKHENTPAIRLWAAAAKSLESAMESNQFEDPCRIRKGG